jgi:hypothetical protein
MAQRDPLGVNVGEATGDMKQRRHLLDIVRHDERVRLARRLARVVTRYASQ